MSRRRATGVANGAEGIEAVVSNFGRAVTKKIATGQGSGEDHLRGPFERMLSDLARSLGLSIITIGETKLPDLSIRPDYAVNVDGARVGYVELKKPGNGVPDTWNSPSRHDVDQWAKYQMLPNVLYTDGEQFARYNFGVLQGEVARLAPGLSHAGDKLQAAGTGFARVMTDFLIWEPEQPRSLGELVRLVSRLCGLLREDVAAELMKERSGRSDRDRFSRMASEWRQLLFPRLTDPEFADQYAQTVTFALLLARMDGVSFTGRSIVDIARLLGKKHSLMGRALTMLTDQPEEEHSVALTTMLRVLSVVDWSDFPEGSYSMLYEDFLERYDPKLRRASGVYYTPGRLVSFLTRFVDDILKLRLGRELGFADKDVIVVDPAMGTGSFLAEVVNKVAMTIGRIEGEGSVAPQLRELSKRLIGFENQAAPYAIAELRIHALLRKQHGAEVPRQERRYLADTLGDPDAQALPSLGGWYEAIERSQQGANRVKREEPVMVVIGNPPYVNGAKGQAPWIERPSSKSGAPSLSAFYKSGNRRREYVLYNKYVYFWRWATWKTFDAHPDHPIGVVAFICSAAFLAGEGFAGMREYLRVTADEGWIVDLSPEGHRPRMESRFFRGNQQSICVAVFIRRGEPDQGSPARVWRTAVTGSVDEKAKSMEALSIDGAEWRGCETGWSDPFEVAASDSWLMMPALRDLMPWATPGVKPNRTWVYAPEPGTLRKRWDRLVQAPLAERRVLLQETRDSKVAVPKAQVAGMAGGCPIASERQGCPEPRLIGHRSFDRKWCIPDIRVHDTPRPPLWLAHSDAQVYVVEQHAQPVTGGPAIVFSALIPDMHYHSNRGGRVLPLYRDSEAGYANIVPGLLKCLSQWLKCSTSEEDLVAYIAALTSHSAYTRRFAEELRSPGVRIPLTRSRALWMEAVRTGEEVLWLHTFGERYVDRAAGRPRRGPRASVGGPVVRVRIPDTAEGMPEGFTYDEGRRTLHVGEGQIAPVSPEAVAYEVSGMNVLRQWFGYRRRSPAGRRTSPLNDIVAEQWTPSMTTELLNLLRVLERCVLLEPGQDKLLAKIMGGRLVTVDDLESAGVLPASPAAARAPQPNSAATLFDE